MPGGDAADMDGLTEREQERMARFQQFEREMSGDMQQQSSRPQTMAYGLADSPAGELAWITEKLKEWTDPHSDSPEGVVGLDELLTFVSSYWFTNTAGTSANLYHETWHDPSGFVAQTRTKTPPGVAVSLTQGIALRRFAEREYNVVHWGEFDAGGHLAELENPEFLTREVREFFRSVRQVSVRQSHSPQSCRKSSMAATIFQGRRQDLRHSRCHSESSPSPIQSAGGFLLYSGTRPWGANPEP